MNEKMISLIDFWKRQAVSKKLFPRAMTARFRLNPSVITDIVGVRRSGKSALFPLLMQTHDLPEEQCLVMNFEDPFFILHPTPEVMEELVEVYLQHFSPDLKYLFFDEVQAIPEWERAIRKLQSLEKYVIIVTGSSSKMLSREMSTLLTGRHQTQYLSPLSFAEFLTFQNIRVASLKDLATQRPLIKEQFRRYMEYGGFPRAVLDEDVSLLKSYFHDILQKDVAFRHEVREHGVLEKIAVFLISNSAKTYSIASIKKAFGISYALAERYISFCREAFLLFELPRFSFSLKGQSKSAKKIYTVDHGLMQAVSFRFSENQGRVLENMVFTHLANRHEKLFYHRESHECDFLSQDGGDITGVYQVCHDLNDDTRRREESGLLEACAAHQKKEGVIITHDQEDEYKKGDVLIRVIPAWRFLLADGLTR